MTERTLVERLRTYVRVFDALRDADTNAPEIAHRDMVEEAAAALERLEASDFERRILRRVLGARDDEALVDTAHRVARERERLEALEAFTEFDARCLEIAAAVELQRTSGIAEVREANATFLQGVAQKIRAVLATPAPAGQQGGEE